MRALVIIVLALALLGTAPAQATPWPLANDTLLHSARLWEARERGDLAVLALQKLVAARPDSPQVLQELGELALRMGDIDLARSTLEQLQRRFPGSLYAKTFALEFDLGTRNRLQLASLQRLIEVKDFTAARRELKRLFPDGAPQGFLAIEYYRMLAKLPGTRAQVIRGLRSLSEQHPDEPRYQLALANHLSAETATNGKALALLDQLTHRDDIRQRDVDDALISTLSDAGAESNSTDILKAYLKRHPDDSAARKLLAERYTREQREQTWQRRALSLLEPVLQSYSVTEVQNRLAALSATNPVLKEALAHWRELDFHLAKNKQVSADIAHWQTQAEQALTNHDYANADLNFRIGLSLIQADVTAAIQLAKQLETQGRDEDAGKLLAANWQANPDSGWSFSTYLRWLLDHGRINDAFSALQTLPHSVDLSPAARNELLASALQKRAEMNATSKPDAAIADLEQALLIAPKETWARYRLANLYADRGEEDRGEQIFAAAVASEPHDATLRYAQALYLARIDKATAARIALQSVSETNWSEDMRSLDARLERTLLKQDIDTLVAAHREAEAAHKLDALLALTPHDRGLRLWRAELDQRMGNAQSARDRLALLVAEDPTDLDTRLDYVRALLASGDINAARVQLSAVAQRASATDANLQLSLARRAYQLDDFALAKQSIAFVMAAQPSNAEAYLLAGRIALAHHDVRAAREHFLKAERLNTSPTSHEARALREQLDESLSPVLSAAVIIKHKPGDTGISAFDSITIPSAYRVALNDSRQLTLRADAVSVSTGDLPDDFSAAQLLGRIYAAGSSATRLRHSGAQRGLTLAALVEAENWALDIGTTPLGFLTPNLVGGFNWKPNTKLIDVSTGVERRAVTSSVLSYAGMRDPITGEKWGGVTATGPYVQAGIYRGDYSISGSLRVNHISGAQVLSNQAFTARLATDWRWLNGAQDQSWLGLTLNLWRYQHNLQNYTLGSGGYYSPQSYVSLSLPLEWQGSRQKFSYQARLAVAVSHSKTDPIDYYPLDSSLQQQAMAQAQLNNDGAPVFEGGSSTGLSFSASVKAERLLTEHIVLGSQLSLDRSDYYHPIEWSLYLRWPFDVPARTLTPPKALRPYND